MAAPHHDTRPRSGHPSAMALCVGHHESGGWDAVSRPPSRCPRPESRRRDQTVRAAYRPPAARGRARGAAPGRAFRTAQQGAKWRLTCPRSAMLAPKRPMPGATADADPSGTSSSRRCCGALRSRSRPPAVMEGRDGGPVARAGCRCRGPRCPGQRQPAHGSSGASEPRARSACRVRRRRRGRGFAAGRCWRSPPGSRASSRARAGSLPRSPTRVRRSRALPARGRR
jgi:hypothetical protein